MATRLRNNSLNISNLVEFPVNLPRSAPRSPIPRQTHEQTGRIPRILRRQFARRWRSAVRFGWRRPQWAIVPVFSTI
jgi:hypothetical protein